VAKDVTHTTVLVHHWHALKAAPSLRHLTLQLPTVSLPLHVVEAWPAGLQTLDVWMREALTVDDARRLILRNRATLRHLSLRACWNSDVLSSCLPETDDGGGGGGGSLEVLRLESNDSWCVAPSARDCDWHCVEVLAAVVRAHAKLRHVQLTHGQFVLDLDTITNHATGMIDTESGALTGLGVYHQAEYQLNAFVPAPDQTFYIDLLRTLPVQWDVVDVTLTSNEFQSLLAFAQTLPLLEKCKLNLQVARTNSTLWIDASQVAAWCKKFATNGLYCFKITAGQLKLQVCRDTTMWCRFDNLAVVAMWHWLDNPHVVFSDVIIHRPAFTVDRDPIPESFVHGRALGLQTTYYKQEQLNQGGEAARPYTLMVTRREKQCAKEAIWSASAVQTAFARMPRLQSLFLGASTVTNIGQVLRACADHLPLRELQLVTDEPLLHDDVLLLRNLTRLELMSVADLSTDSPLPLCTQDTLAELAERHPRLTSLMLDMMPWDTRIGSSGNASDNVVAASATRGWQAVAQHPTLLNVFLGLCTAWLTKDEIAALVSTKPAYSVFLRFPTTTATLRPPHMLFLPSCIRIVTPRA
jgi:hypothetical protein